MYTHGWVSTAFPADLSVAPLGLEVDSFILGCTGGVTASCWLVEPFTGTNLIFMWVVSSSLLQDPHGVVVFC